MGEDHDSGLVAGAPSARPGNTQIMADGVEVRRLEKLRITVVDSPDGQRQDKSFTFAQDEIRVGSSPDADVHIDDPSVSRHHLAIRQADRSWAIHDNASTNGTYIGDLAIDTVRFRDVAMVRLGQTVLRLQPLGEHVEQKLSPQKRFGRMLGESATMREMFAVLEKVACSDLTVLVEGETGTGKELAATGLHDASARSGPFITLNCGAIPRQLIESELMGHVKGAFTGAVADRPGAFLSAHQGTLFLDEVGELPLDMQAKLLRVLERREVKPVGSDKTRQVDVRVLAATNRNLVRDAEAGTFRQDLYFRLAVVVVRIPPLRTRMSDLPMLVDHIQGELNRRRVVTGQAPYEPLGETAMAMLRRYDFPGNVRELRNIVERWSVLGAHAAPGNPAVRSGVTDAGVAKGGPGQVEDALLLVPYHEAKEAWVERFERAYVVAALDRAAGNVSQASREAEVDRRHLQRLMARYDIKRR